MTGWWIGHLLGRAPMLRVMATVLEQMASCVNAALRLSHALSEAVPEEGLDRLAAGLARVREG